MSDRWQSPCGRMELRLGDYREALADVQAHSFISDPPYSPRQAEGFRTHDDHCRKGGPVSGKEYRKSGITAFQGMPYAPMDQAFADVAVRLFGGANWHVTFGDHISFRWWERAAIDAGRYCFAPVVWLRGNQPRFQGDGPCSAAEYICVSRPRRKTRCGSLPGFYETPYLRSNSERIVTGQKPVDLMRAIVRDYSRPGDLIVDPCAGGGTTLLAAAIEGRRAIGAELDPDTYAKAVERLSRGYTPAMLAAEPVTGEQGGLEL